MPAIDREACGSRKRNSKTLFPPPLPFGSSVKATSACYRLRSLPQIHMCSPYRLSSTHPACGCQKGTPLTICAPHLAMLRYIVRVALYSDSWIHPVTRAVPSYIVRTTTTSDLVSHLDFLYPSRDVDAWRKAVGESGSCTKRRLFICNFTGRIARNL